MRDKTHQGKIEDLSKNLVKEGKWLENVRVFWVHFFPFFALYIMYKYVTGLG